MPRDYKHHSSRARRRNPVSPWLGLLAGLLIGLFIAFLIYIKMLAPKHPELAAETQESVDTSMEAAPEEAKQPAGEKTVPPRPRFEFYAILPEMEVIVPEEEIQASAAKPAPVVEKSASREKPAAPHETYYLQAGSFRGAAQADRFKARLAILGFETDIQTITINNKDTYHRVRVGPFHDLVTLQKARSKLGEQGIETRTVKIKG
jgi:cell division protein FtsN